MNLRSLPYFLFLLFLGACISEEKTESIKVYKNLLSKSSNPYLRGHADNPVDWYEWGSEALEKAQVEDKPVIISIGYSACHWCHVMEEESFMDTTVASVMNKNFISIKVDREERPDIDKIYMDAAVLLNGSGGWPLNVIALPDGRPFYAGTYFTKAQWEKLLSQVAVTYKNNKEELVQTANALTEGIRKGNSLDDFGNENSEAVKEIEYIGLIEGWKDQFDTYRGGYKGDQKFPLAISWNALLQYYYLTGDEEVLEFVKVTLDNMAKGGIFDHVGGGFSRYTTDSKWLVPHFEKMLYDNALLISAYSNAYKLTNKNEYAQVVRQSIKFIERELSNGDGGYYSSINADSNGDEGQYYVWTVEEVKTILDADEAKIIQDFYNIESYGNWEDGKSVLYKNYFIEEYAKENNRDYSELKTLLEGAQEKMFRYREKRHKPTVDSKIIASWNALMVQAYIDAFAALGDDDYLQKAKKAAKFLTENLLDSDHKVVRSYMNGKKGRSGYLDDYSYLTNAFLSLYQITFDEVWLKQAQNLTDYTIAQFWNADSGMFYYASKNNEELITRPYELEDNVMPSSNSVMALNLFVLGELTLQKEYSERSERMMGKMLVSVKEDPSSFANWTRLLGYKSFGTFEIAILGEEALQKNILLQQGYLPTAIFMGGKSESLPLLKDKLVAGSTLIYVCQNKTCKYPVSDVNEARTMLNNYKTTSFKSFFEF